ncbi:hypothetical protein ABI59_17570 [Acidobacteria bacterium Mor1]|nr:hypothetical protein ABI59_17570 [Acidobacteria bacterium Mor1]
MWTMLWRTFRSGDAILSPEISGGNPIVENRQGKRYRGFISYSQEDISLAKRLHLALSFWRAPKGVKLAGLAPDRGLGSFFRDEEEMGAADSLRDSLKRALDNSDNLIVLATPRSAQSDWVGMEIRHFRERGHGRVFAVVARGPLGFRVSRSACFHPALLERVELDRSPAGEPEEPLAPDLGREGLRKVATRLAAGLLDVSFDTLWKHEQRRRTKRLLVSSASLFVGAALAIASGIYLVGTLTERVADERATRFAVAAERLSANGDHARALLLALHGDPAAQSGRMKSIFSPTGYPRAMAAVQRAYTHNHLLATIDAGEQLMSISFAPDGRRIVSGSGSGIASIWDTHTGSTLRTIFAHDGAVGALAVSRDGELLVTGSSDRQAKLWETKTGNLLETFDGHGHAVTAVSFSPDAKLVLTGCADGIARLWNLEAKLLRAFPKHPASITSVSIGRDGSTLLTAAADGQATLWRIDQDKPVQTFLGDSDGISSAALSPDGKQVLLGNYDGSATLWTVGQETPRRSFAEGRNRLAQVAFSPDGAVAAVGSGPGTTYLLMVDSLTRLQTLAGHDGPILSLAFSPDGSRLATTAGDGTIKFWAIGSDSLIRTLSGHTGSVSATAFSSNGKYALTGSRNGEVFLWSRDNETIPRAFSAGRSQVTDLALDASGAKLLAASVDGVARVWSLEKQELLRSIGARTRANTAILSGDGRRLFVLGVDSTATLWDLDRGSAKPVLSIGVGTATSAAFAPNDRDVLLGTSENGALLWETSKDTLLRSFPTTSSVTSVAISRDGHQILTGSYRDTATLWSVADQEPRRVFAGTSRGIVAVAFAPSGEFVLTGSLDGTAALWSVEADVPIQTFFGHVGQLRSVTFSPEGTHVLTGSIDRTAKLWAIDPFLTMSAKQQVDAACAKLVEIGVTGFTSEERERFPILKESRETPCYN